VNRPNIVLFMPDQLRADAVGCFGRAEASTPTIDALAARGVRFDDAWAQHPVCGPSRVSILTGWYPHVAGHRTLDNLIEEHEPNLFKILREAGDHVAIAGDRGDVFAPGVTESSSDFCGFLDPPVDALSRYTSPYPDDHRRHRAMYFGESGDVLDARPLGDARPDRCRRRRGPAGVHGRLPRHLRMGRPVDRRLPRDRRQVPRHGQPRRCPTQRVLAAVDDIGATDDTVVGFFADHGEYLGDFGLVGSGRRRWIRAFCETP